MTTEERAWHKASYSSGSGNCVEVSEGTETLVRDTQNRGLGYLRFETKEWSALLNTLKK
ncbi:DUF397 domain-containing protein [Nocardiopsis alba]|uniref:DUF397 domain-containing protein n=1 Tax=Nocardiopsis alba TaxID=53437 RepID=UPI003404297D